MRFVNRALPIAAASAALLVCGQLFLMPSPTLAQQSDKEAVSSAVATLKKYTPGSTRVAILPVIDKSGEKDDQRKDQANAVKLEAYDQFYQRGFQVVDEATVAKSLSDSGINFDDEEEWRKENMYKVGKAANADLVLFVVVNQAYSKVKQNAFNQQREGLAKTKVWLLDAKESKPILSAHNREGKSTGSMGIGQKGNRSQMGAACANAIRDVANAVLADFPRDKNKKWADKNDAPSEKK